MITRKTKISGITALLFFIGSAIGTFLIWQYIQNAGEELVQQTNEIADFEAREKTYRELEVLVNSTQASRDELHTYVLTEGETVDFLATIEQAAVEQGVVLTTDSLQVKDEKDLFDTLVISYTIEGDKNHVESMVLLLETLPYHALVSSLSLRFSSKDGREQAVGFVELSISLLKYDR